VAEMKVVLKVQQKELQQAERQAEEDLKVLTVGSKEAAEKKAAADIVEGKCRAQAAEIKEEKDAADVLLEGAKPLVREAEAAAKMVTKAAVQNITNLSSPPDLLRRCLDTVLILMMQPLRKIEVDVLEKTFASNDDRAPGGKLPFIAPSWFDQAKPYMQSPNFLSDVLLFGADVQEMPDGIKVPLPKPRPKDIINEETMELLEPYMNVYDYHAKRMSAVFGSAVGLLVWCIAMKNYHKAALVVGPLQEQLEIKSSQLRAATKQLNAALAESKAAQDKVDALHASFAKTEAAKAELQRTAQKTEDKMAAANRLIKSLSGEKIRWTEDQGKFQSMIDELVGNVALASAFVSYLGPFNFEFRKMLMARKFTQACQEKRIPCTVDLELTKFLADEGLVAQWNSEGLPKDELSVQNGILVTGASRVPLLIDPQAQAITWIKKRCGDSMISSSVSDKGIKDKTKRAMSYGMKIMIEGVNKDLDPIFDNCLERNLIPKGKPDARGRYKKFSIKFGDEVVDYDTKDFALYLFNNQSNPIFSPELSAKSTVIDFSVTQKGLEDQLLSRVIQMEQKSLEEQRQAKVEEVNENTIRLTNLDKELLKKLSASEGDILEDIKLIQLLEKTKVTAVEVSQTIQAAESTQKVIDAKREQYRAVAGRGSILYFTMTSLSLVNTMYQTSLAMYLTWFDATMHEDQRVVTLVTDRVKNLIETLTFKVYANISRGIFEKDKNVFKLMMTMNILRNEFPDEVTAQMVTTFLQGRSGVSNIGTKPWKWMSEDAWGNISALIHYIKDFGDL
jgi:dynein heavy chain